MITVTTNTENETSLSSFLSLFLFCFVFDPKKFSFTILYISFWEGRMRGWGWGDFEDFYFPFLKWFFFLRAKYKKK